ncbi:MAG: Lrp/AsnC family transcriptional regulator [Synergistaceae bacterium]|jgi:Lrp/AsnC family leucine-responsive transcriptional regulator|nr:Lrp/AsnC family transcriptional regulator [Synergistaceae bacterium]
MREEKVLDEIGAKILGIIQENGRISYSELGREVGLSSPAVAARVHQLEERGYIKEYRAQVVNEKLGFPFSAFITVSPVSGDKGMIDTLAREMPEIVEEHHLTGMDERDGIILKVVFSSMSHLETIIDKIARYGETATSVVLSSSVQSRVLAARQ